MEYPESEELQEVYELLSKANTENALLQRELDGARAEIERLRILTDLQDKTIGGYIEKTNRLHSRYERLDIERTMLSQKVAHLVTACQEVLAEAERSYPDKRGWLAIRDQLRAAIAKAVQP